MKDGLLDRVTKLEAFRDEIVKTIQAMARVVGPNEVHAELAAGVRAEMEEVVTTAVKNGQLKKASVVGEESFVVGQEQQKDGGLVFPGRFQTPLKALQDEPRVLLLGRKVGEKMALPNGNTITLTEVYEPAESKKPKKAKSPKAVRAAKSEPAPVSN